MTREEAVEALTRLEISNFRSGKSYLTEAFVMAINALRTEPCEDCISRKAAINAIDGLYLDGESAQGFTADANGDCLIGKYKAIELLDDLSPVTIKNKEEKRMSDLIKRSAALKPYEGLKDDDLISVMTIRENLEHVQTVEVDGIGRCSTCKHFPNDENCKGCLWDANAKRNTKWELRVLEEKTNG